MALQQVYWKWRKRAQKHNIYENRQHNHNNPPSKDGGVLTRIAPPSSSNSDHQTP